MPELRWILLVAGIAIIAGVYLYSRMTGTNGRGRKQQRREPRFDDSLDDPVEDSFDVLVSGGKRPLPEADIPVADEVDEADDAKPAGGAAPVAERRKDEKIVVLHVAARGGEKLHGVDIVRVLDSEGLVHGRYRIFHRHTATTGGGVNVATTLYSVASMTEPGAIALDQLESLYTAGLSFFMVLPGPVSGAEAFSDMLATARRVSGALGAELLDEQGSTLSQQAAAHIREEIINFEHRLRHPLRR